MIRPLWLSWLAVSTLSSAAVHPVPRVPTGEFLEQGEFSGGEAAAAILANIRLGKHKDAGFERWVVDFADPETKALGKTAPRFLIQYLDERKRTSEDGNVTLLAPARLLVHLRGIRDNQVSPQRIESLVKSSLLVENVVMYPQIEGGDMVLEMRLRGPAAFALHQPKEKEGRLVLDLRPRPSQAGG